METQLKSESKASTLKNILANDHLDFLPLRKTTQGYNLEFARGDLRAAFNVALLAFPQGMAYAIIAGLPIQYGIFGSIIASLIGMYFAGSPFIVLGPTNATSVILMTSFIQLGVSDSEKLLLVPLLLVMVGLFLIIGAYFKVASLIQYISRTVVTGYITAAACLIIANQFKNALGFNFSEEDKPNTFYEIIFRTIEYIPKSDLPSVILSIATFILYWLLSKKCKGLPHVAICLIIMSFIAFGMSYYGFPVNTLDAISATNWTMTLPSLDPKDMELLSGAAFAIALLCVLEGTSIGKSLAARTGSRIDPNQEMMSIGMANIGCGLFSGMAASGSLTRSVLNANSGAKTPMSSFYAGIICVIGAFLFGPLIKFVPLCALSVLVIFIGISLINKNQIRIVTKSTQSDAIVFYITVGCGMIFSLTTAIYAGVVVSIILFLRKVSTPELVEYQFDQKGGLAQLDHNKKRSETEISIVHVEGELFFAAAELFNEQIRRVCEDENLKILVLKMRNAYNLDATSVMAFQELIQYMNEKDRIVIVSEVRPDTMRIFNNSGLIDTLNPLNVFQEEGTNPTLSTAKALKRAKEILGSSDVKVTIFADEVKKN